MTGRVFGHRGVTELRFVGEGMMTQNEAERVVRNHYDFIAQRDRDALLETLSEDVDWELMGPKELPIAGRRIGRKEVNDFFEIIRASIDVKEFRIDEIISHGNRVIVFGFEQFLVKDTGKAWSANWVHVHTVEGGEIKTFREYTDTAAILAAYANEKRHGD